VTPESWLGSPRIQRLRDAAKPIALSALAAALAWLIAREVAGHAAPFFAPGGGPRRADPRVSVTVLIAQVRSLAQDLLLALGLEEEAALRAIEAA
jgi:hypothetical protein